MCHSLCQPYLLVLYGIFLWLENASSDTQTHEHTHTHTRLVALPAVSAITLRESGQLRELWNKFFIVVYT